MAQEKLQRPVDAAESYRQAVARGMSSPEITARITALEQQTAADRPQTAVAEVPDRPIRH
jgi:HAMP domain-containing protein